MKVYVYWNRKNHDCAKIFHFMSSNDKYSIVDCLQQENELEVDRVYTYYVDALNVIEKISKSELIIFMTHGTEEYILKYQNDPERNIKEFVLIDKEKAKALKNKIVLAFCCSSAKRLGRYCVAPEIGCKAFVGFENDIVYDNGKAEKTRHIIYESYKIAFMKSLQYAVKSKCTVEEYYIRLMQLLRYESAKAIIESENHTLNNMYSGTISGLVALGDAKVNLFQ